MKIKGLLCAFVFCGGIVVPHASAEPVGYDFTTDDSGSSEGFVFTDEDVAAADAEEARKLAALLTDGHAYKAKCRQVYQNLMVIVGNCHRGVGKNVDLTECLDSRPLADCHKEAASRLMGTYGVIPSTGQVTIGLFTRKNLAKAKPNMTSADYATVDMYMTRTETMLKWFLGPYAQFCALVDEDCHEMVQMAARTAELIRSSEMRSAREKYWRVIQAFDKAVELSEEFKVKPGDEYRKAEFFFECYGNLLDQKEINARCQGYLNSADKTAGEIIRFRNTGSSFQACAEGTKMVHLNRVIEYWNEDRIKAVTEMGKRLSEARSRFVNSKEYTQYRQTLQQEPKDYYADVHADYHKITEPLMDSMIGTLVFFEEKLEEEGHISLRKRLNGVGMIARADKAAKVIAEHARESRDNAAQIIPASHQFRKSN